MKPNYWVMAAIAVLAIGALLYFTWNSGKVWGEMEDQRIALDLNRLKQNVVETQLELKHEKQQTELLKKEVSKSGETDSLALVADLRKELLQSQAEANQYQEVIVLEQKALLENTKLLDALSNPGARLMPLKGTEAAADSTAYALIVESSHMLFVASNLPQPAEGKQYQLWVLRRQEPKLVSAGVFSPDQRKRAWMDFATPPALLSDIAELQVTQEPQGGSETPTGDRLFTAITERSEKGSELN